LYIDKVKPIEIPRNQTRGAIKTKNAKNNYMKKETQMTKQHEPL